MQIEVDHGKARWVRGHVGYPIRQCVELVLRDPEWGERGLSVFVCTSIPSLYVAVQRLSKASHFVIAIVSAFVSA